MRVFQAALAAALVLGAGAARAADPSELIANAHASAVGGCACGNSQDQTLLTADHTQSLFSSASHQASGGGATAFVTTEFGTQRAFANAHIPLTSPAPDAQSVAYSRYVEYFDAGVFGSGPNLLSFAITGTQSPQPDFGPGPDAILNWDLEDVTSGHTITFGTWDSNANSGAVLRTFFVPLHDITALRVDFEVSAYSGRTVDNAVAFADYSHTVHTYIDRPDGGPVVGRSGHDYATPAAASGAPEASTWAMLIVGLAGVGISLRRRAGRRPPAAATATA